MANNAKTQVINRLKRYLNEEDWLVRARKKNPHFASEIENLSEKQISFGDQPTLTRGYIKGNATGSGENTYGDTTTRRTVSIDFTTDEKLFAQIGNKASMETCRAATEYVLTGFNASDVLETLDARKVADERGKYLCRQSLSDLNFSMNDYRLNRYNIVTTSDPFRVPIWPIMATIESEKGKEREIFLGYFYTSNKKNYIHLNIAIPLTGKQKWTIFGVISGIVLVLIAILYIILQ